MKLNKSLLRFLSIAFGVAWITEAIIIILEHTVLPVGGVYKGIVMTLVFLGGCLAPFFAAFFTRKNEDKSYTFKSLLKDIFKTEDLLKTLVVLALIMIVQLIVCICTETSNGLPWYMWLPMLILMIPGGGLEEVGWRGYFYPAILKKTNFFVASLVQGILWAVWHFPLWFVQNANQSTFNFPSFFIYCIALSFSLGLLIQITHSTWAAIVLHAWMNTTFGGMYSFNCLTSEPTISLVVISVVEIVICTVISFIYTKRKSSLKLNI